LPHQLKEGTKETFRLNRYKDHNIEDKIMKNNHQYSVIKSEEPEEQNPSNELRDENGKGSQVNGLLPK
jgi:hypothetical protein